MSLIVLVDKQVMKKYEIGINIPIYKLFSSIILFSWRYLVMYNVCVKYDLNFRAMEISRSPVFHYLVSFNFL